MAGGRRQERQQPGREGNLGGAVKGECSTTTGLWNQGSGKRRCEDRDSQVEALGSGGIRGSGISARN